MQKLIEIIFESAQPRTRRRKQIWENRCYIMNAEIKHSDWMFKLSYMTICSQSERLIYAILSSKLLMTFAPDLYQEGTDESSKQ